MTHPGIEQVYQCLRNVSWLHLAIIYIPSPILKLWVNPLSPKCVGHVMMAPYQTWGHKRTSACHWGSPWPHSSRCSHLSCIHRYLANTTVSNTWSAQLPWSCLSCNIVKNVLMVENVLQLNTQITYHWTPQSRDSQWEMQGQSFQCKTHQCP